MIDIGGRRLDRTCVERIDKVKGLSKYASSLCGMLFTMDELQTPSLTGSSCNFPNGKASIKKQLPPEVVAAFISK
jgi:hypothetical protein